MKKILTLTLALLILTALPSCSGNDVVEDILSSIPKESQTVMVVNVQQLAEKAGCNVKDGSIEISSQISSLVDSDKARNALKLISRGAIDNRAVAIFIYHNKSYITGIIKDKKEFDKGIESITGKTFYSQGDVEICGNVVRSEDRFWICESDALSQTSEATSYAFLKENFSSSPLAAKLISAKEDITAVAPVDMLSSIPDGAAIFASLTSAFDDLKAIYFSLNFEKGKIAGRVDMLNSDLKTAKTIMPLDKINLSVVNKLQGKMNMIFALAIDPKMFDNIPTSFKSNPQTAILLNILSKIKGTVAIGIGTEQEDMMVVVEMRSKDAAMELGNTVKTILGSTCQVSVKNKLLILRTAIFDGTLDIGTDIKTLDNASMGFIISGQAISALRPGLSVPFTSASLTMKTDDGGAYLSLEALTTDSDVNALPTFIKLISQM